MTDRRALVSELLSILERKEAELLSWGFWDVAFSSNEISKVFRESGEGVSEAWDEWVAEIGDAELLLDNLAEARLLVRVLDHRLRYRTRFAETVRLLGRLRQRFKADDWNTAPELVSDIKIHLAARKYPKRNLPADEFWRALAECAWDKTTQEQVLRALAQIGGQSLSFSAFQLRAAQRILSNYRTQETSSGSVVSAGTGSGKTKAFYIPAFMGIAADIQRDARSFTKVLAIYPRNVLLADQFTEAVGQALMFGNVLRRPVTFGALLQDVPFTEVFDERQYALRNWKRIAGGWSPPFLKNPFTSGSLVWLDEDRQARRTMLRDAADTQKVILPDGMVLLTREAIRAQPPDILMMSVEMLNKEICSPVNQSLLGFRGAIQAPRLVLLDEIHTYEGLAGAQMPWIIRRWNYWVRRYQGQGSAPHFVGLSATLREAPSHLSMLTGVLESNVAEIRPEESLGEFDSEGIEYNLALKSHSGSGASVLATSIQTVLLGARLLTPAAAPPCSGTRDKLEPQCFYSRKVFGFTDNLDVLNRWLKDNRDADANKRLARLRSAAQSTTQTSARMIAGQVWDFSERLGYDLNQTLRISRTSSQDPGVDAQADVVLATSSLEVGYDDPDVGMVVHHKAPRSAASFLQRKGRAGRQRGTRPWTLVVLSDFGRDRWAFRDSESLFQPELAPLSLPCLNPYVVRVQATQFLLDWIGQRIPNADPYRYLARPSQFARSEADAARRLLELVVSDPNKRDELTNDFVSWFRSASLALRISDPAAMATQVLWQMPRPVLRHAVPELLKLLDANFQDVTPSTVRQDGRVLARFLPRATFDQLGAQDVLVSQENGEDQEVDVVIALREATPGHVSRRYAVQARDRSLWHQWSPQLLSAPPDSVSVEELFPECFQIALSGSTDVFQPRALKLTHTTPNVLDSSSARWIWTVHIESSGERQAFAIAEGPVLSKAFSAVDGFLHRNQANLRKTRFSSEFTYDVLLPKDRRHRGRISLSTTLEDGTRQTQGIGYSRAVDGLVFTLRSTIFAGRLRLPNEVLAAFRPLFYKYQLTRSPVVSGAASGFAIQALWMSSVAMLSATALAQRATLERAATLIPDRVNAARKVYQRILLGEAYEEGADGDGQPDLASNRRIAELQRLWQDESVRIEVCRLEQVLWSAPGAEFIAWVDEVLRKTLAEALLQAVHSLIPEIADGELEVDVIEQADGYAMVLSETSAGGVGHLERLLGELDSGVGRLDAAYEAALANCPHERIAELINRALAAAKQRDSDTARAFQEARDARSFADFEMAKTTLIGALLSEGLETDRSSVSALVGKVLKPGSSRVSDSWIRALVRRRQALNRRLGIELDPRVFAYWCTENRTINTRMAGHLRTLGGGFEPTPQQVYNAFVNLALEGCKHSCSHCLGTDGEMIGVTPSRWLAYRCLGLGDIDYVVTVDDSGAWRRSLRDALESAKRIKLQYSISQGVRVAAEVSMLLSKEHDRGYLFAPFVVTGASRRGQACEMLLQPTTDFQG